jgi:holo-[acyl-carrier protein] synthase
MPTDADRGEPKDHELTQHRRIHSQPPPKPGRVVSIGTDIVECDRIAEMLAKHSEEFLRRVFTDGEREYCTRHRKPVTHLAGRWAAKEAVLKALGTGWSRGIGRRDVEVLRDAAGRPSVALHGAAASIAAECGIARVLLSISHCDSHAVAFATAVAE